jgi:hypothetical protein
MRLAGPDRPAVVVDHHRVLVRPAAGHPVGSYPWQALTWFGRILAGSVALSGALFRRRTA